MLYMLVGALIVDSVPVFLIDCDQAFRFSPEVFTQRDSDVEGLPYRELPFSLDFYSPFFGSEDE
jgi:hypothetical protein